MLRVTRLIHTGPPTLPPPTPAPHTRAASPSHPLPSTVRPVSPQTHLPPKTLDSIQQPEAPAAPASTSPHPLRPQLVNSRWNLMQSLLLLGRCVLSRIRLSVTPRGAARQAPLSTGFSRQEDWSGLPFPSPGDLPDPGIEPIVSCVSCTAGRFFTHRANREAPAPH